MLFFIFVMPFNTEADGIIKKGESLNLERCIEIALKKHPDIIAAKNTVHANETRVGQAKANYYPLINWASSYSRNSSASRSKDSLLTRTEGAFDQYSTGFSLSQTIYDFGKIPTQVKIQTLTLDSSRSDLENVTEQIIFLVKEAYYRVLEAKWNRIIAEDTVMQAQQHLEQAQGFFEVGTRPKFDVTKAEVDLSNAKLGLIKAENAYRLAVVNLNNTMGIPDAPEYILDENISFEKYEITFEDALSMSYQNRPDLQSIIAKRQASEISIELAKKDYYPTVTGNAAYTWTGERFPLENGWNVGTTVSFPLFSGFLTKYQVEEAKATLNILKADEESVKQSVFLDVQQAYLNLKDAEERIPAAELNVKHAEENFEIAKGRYAAGVGNPIEVTDAEVILNNARTAYIQALYDYKVAQASLEKAMGKR